MASVYFIGVLLNSLKQSLSLVSSHLTGLRLGLLVRLRLLFLRRFLGLRALIRIFVGIRILLPVLIFLFLVLVVLFPVLGLGVLLLLLLLLLLKLLERQLEIVFVVDLPRVDAQGLLVRFETLLEPLLAIEGVPQVVPCGCCERRVARFDRSLVGIQSPDVLLRFVECVPVVEESERASAPSCPCRQTGRP